MTVRIFVDFNRTTSDEQGDRVFVGKEGTWQVESFPFKPHLAPGKTIYLFDGELQVKAIVEFDAVNRSWYARPDWSTRRDLESRADGLQHYADMPAEDRLVALRYETGVLLKVIQGYADLFARIGRDSPESLPKDFMRSVGGLTKAANDVRAIIDLLTTDNG